MNKEWATQQIIESGITECTIRGEAWILSGVSG